MPCIQSVAEVSKYRGGNVASQGRLTRFDRLGETQHSLRWTEPPPGYGVSIPDVASLSGVLTLRLRLLDWDRCIASGDREDAGDDGCGVSSKVQVKARPCCL